MPTSGCSAVDVATLPFPGFATDFMPQVVALLGDRRRHRDRHRERVRQPAQRSWPSSPAWAPTCVTRAATPSSAGWQRLSGAPVRALDVRAGAALVLAGLAAEGETVVLDPCHVDRGYPDLAATLSGAGRHVVEPCGVPRRRERGRAGSCGATSEPE